MNLDEIEANSLPESDPMRHVSKVHHRLGELRDHLREDIEKIDEPQAQAMFETSAEVLQGLMETFEDYAESDEAAWT